VASALIGAVLEDGLDDEVAARQVLVVGAVARMRAQLIVVLGLACARLASSLA
jgi:hypothetical protein